MTSILLIAPSVETGELLVAHLDDRLRDQVCVREDVPERIDVKTVVLLPRSDCRNSCLPDIAHSAQVLTSLNHKPFHLILVSSAAAYGAHHHNVGLLTEEAGHTIKDENPLATNWRAVEAEAKSLLAGTDSTLTILRPCSVHGVDAPVNILTRDHVRLAFGHNPTVQLLSIGDLASAIGATIRNLSAGTFNLAPRATALLSEVRNAHVAGQSTATARGKCPKSYSKYSWTVSGEKADTELGFSSTSSTLEALGAAEVSEADEFGLSRSLIRAFGRHILRFMEKFYWRIEVRGLEHIPRDGKIVLAGPHRGFMPLDGVMLVHLLTKYTGRTPRFLIHPCLIKFMFLAKFMSRLGGIIACQRNADRVLESNEILGIFPDGIRGAFTMYRDAYKTSRFWRNDFAAMAIRHEAPIIPFAVVGSADMYPIMGKIKWRWWKKLTEWPFFPVTVPLPLPTKWHIEFLPPINPAARADTSYDEQKQATRETNRVVQADIQASIARMADQRPSRFFGTAFPPPNADTTETPNAAQPPFEQQVA